MPQSKRSLARELFARGCSVREVVELAGILPQEAYFVRCELYGPKRCCRTRVAYETRQRIFAERESGQAAVDVAAKYHVCVDYVYRLWRRRPKIELPEGEWFYSDEDHARVPTMLTLWQRAAVIRYRWSPKTAERRKSFAKHRLHDSPLD